MRSRMTRCKRLWIGLFALLLLAQGTHQVLEAVDGSDCDRVRARDGCRTLWELLTCSANRAYAAVAQAAANTNVRLDQVLDNPEVRLTLMVVNDTYFNDTGTWPGMTLPTNGSNGGNTFNPVMAQYWFYYNLLVGDYAPTDLLSPNNTIRTGLYWAFQNMMEASNTVDDGMLANPNFLAVNYTGTTAFNMTMTEGMQYNAGGPPQSARVIGFETACNGYLYQMDNTMMRVIEPGKGLQPSTGGNFPEGFKQPMNLNPMLTYELMCNETDVEEFLTLAYLLSANPDTEMMAMNTSMEFYMSFAPVAPRSMDMLGEDFLGGMSFTMIGLQQPMPYAKQGAQYTLRMVSTLMYAMLPGAWCPDDLVAMGQVNTMLGFVINQWVPLNFTRNGFAGQVNIYTPDGYHIGAISEVYTACRSVFISTSRSTTVGNNPFPEATAALAPAPGLLPLPRQFLTTPADIPPEMAPRDPEDVWNIVARRTKNLKHTPGACQQTFPVLSDLEGPVWIPPPRPKHGPAMPPTPSPPPMSSDSTGTTIAIAVPLAIGFSLFCAGVLAGTCWMYRRQKRQQLAMDRKDMEMGGPGMGGSRSAKGGHAHGITDKQDPSFDGNSFTPSDDMMLLGDGVHPIKPLPMTATVTSVDTKSSDDGNGSPSVLADGTLTPAGPSCGLASSKGDMGDAPLCSSTNGAEALSLQEVLDKLEHSWAIDPTQLQLVRKIGQGSFGEVFCGRWRSTAVAVKKLPAYMHDDPDDARRFSSGIRALQKEVAIMAGLRHPSVVLFLGVSLEPPMLITEYCERGSLFSVMYTMRHSPSEVVATTFDWRRRLSLALDAAVGMEFLHSRGIVHRDLKSPNLLVDRAWHVKVADFGLSKLLDASKSRSSLVVMNPKWLSPEIIRNESHSRASDVYSFGIVLWELMTLREPFEDITNPIQIAFAVANNGARPYTVEDAENVPGGGFDGLQDYITLMHDCWHQNPTERPTFEQVVLRLKTLRRVAISRTNSTAIPTRTSTSSDALRSPGEVTPSGPSDDVLALQSQTSGSHAAAAAGGGDGGNSRIPSASRESLHAPAMAAEAALPSLQGLAAGPLRSSSAETDSSGARGGGGVKFTLCPADPERLLSGGVTATAEGDVADALSVVQSTAAAAAAVELSLAQQGDVDGGSGLDKAYSGVTLQVGGGRGMVHDADVDADVAEGQVKNNTVKAAPAVVAPVVGASSHQQQRSGGDTSGGNGRSNKPKKSWSKFLSGRT